MPDAEHNKSASKIDVQVWIRARVRVRVQVQVSVWIDHVLKTSTTMARLTKALLTSSSTMAPSSYGASY